MKKLSLFSIVLCSLLLAACQTTTPAQYGGNDTSVSINYKSYRFNTTDPVVVERKRYKSNPVEGVSYLTIPKIGVVPYPVVILLSGSGGFNQDEKYIQKAMLEEGYATVVVDPFTPRGFSFSKGVGAKQVGVKEVGYAYDIVAAINSLSEFPELDLNRIGTIGNSMGGGVQTFLASQWFMDQFGLKHKIKTMIPIAPHCWWREKKATPTGSSILLMLGGKDDWNPPKKCDDWAERQKKENVDIEVMYFPNAHHDLLRKTTKQVKAITYHCFDFIFDLQNMRVSSPMIEGDESMYNGGYINFWKKTGCLTGSWSNMTVGGNQEQHTIGMSKIIRHMKSKLAN